MTAYIVAYSIILLSVAAGAAVLSFLWVKTQREKLRAQAEKSAAVKDGELKFVEIFGGGNETDTAFVIIETDTRAPVYISAKAAEFFGIEVEKLYLDLSAIEGSIPKKQWRAALRSYDEWDGTGTLTSEFDYGDDRQAAVRAIRAERDGKCYDAFAVYDITESARERKKLNEQLDEALSEAAGKLSFLSSMSHEIRTPMNGVMGMMELARMNINDPVKAKTYLDRAGDLSVFLLGMINDILDISKIESGKMLLFNTAFDIFAFADKIRNMFNGMVTGKGIEFNVEAVDFDSRSRYLVGDEMRLTQVVTNFVSNANKFTPSGGKITVTFKQLDHIGGKAQVLIRVRDTGKGIAPENIHKIMRPFEQEEASTAHHYGGTGLGLAICDNIVKLMGGSIVVDSVLGKGTDFSVFLSLPIAEEQPVAADTSKAAELPDADWFTFDGCRILLAEDNEVNAEIAVEILESEGAAVTLVGDGQDAVDVFTQLHENSFDVVLLDIQMPRLNGRDAAKAIRASGKADAESVPIVALSADAFVEDVALSIKAGMDAHVSKPIDFDELRKTVGGVIAEKRGGRKGK